MLRFGYLAFLVACTGPTSDASAPDAAAVDASPDAPSENAAVARGQLWVDARVPYCQAANHAHDADPDCVATCDRPDNANWDAYRSDCSGFISWAWGLAAPGHTTATLAPYDTSVSHAIAGEDLQPGDAINNTTHTMLFASWITVGAKARFLEETGCSSDEPYAREYIGNVTLMGDTVVVEFRGSYTAIRHD